MADRPPPGSMSLGLGRDPEPTSPPLSKPRYVEGDPRSIVLLDENARYMTHEQFMTLAANIKQDGHLTSTPFVWNVPEDAAEVDAKWRGRRVVLSGNHRVKAAIEAGLGEIGWLEVDDPLPEQRAIALQLSHNSIAGQDDPATLKRLYDRLEAIEWRHYSGLDDKTLEMLEKVDVSSISEASIDFATVQLMFLPHELEQAKEAVENARKIAQADERWFLAEDQFHPVLDALAVIHEAYGLGSVATAFTVMLAVFNRHLEELREGWWDEESQQVTRPKGNAPFETLFGRPHLPAVAAAVVQQAVDKMVGRGEIDAHAKWRALEFWAAEYLAGQ